MGPDTVKRVDAMRPTRRGPAPGRPDPGIPMPAAAVDRSTAPGRSAGVPRENGGRGSGRIHLVFDAARCTGCRACELACSYHHERVFAPSRARIRVLRFDEEGLDVPVGCPQCADAPCALVCPVRALVRDDVGAVALDPGRCIGCKMCLTACPFGAITFDDAQNRIVKCDLCGGAPACVPWCFTGAIRAIADPGELAAERRLHHASRTPRGRGPGT